MTRAIAMDLESPRRVALFGYYKYGNFGDDLMAVLFGLRLRRAGVSVRVYGLRVEVLDEFGFEGADSIEELVDGASAVVYGGGGAFLRSRREEFEAELVALRSACVRDSLPLWMYSVGGDGAPLAQIPQARRRLLEIVDRLTLRNEEDLAMTVQLDKANVEVWPDVVWRVPAELGVRAARPELPTIGVDASMLVRRRSRWVVRTMTRWLRLRGRRLVLFRQAADDPQPGGFDAVVSYEGTLRPFLDAIAATSAIITHRLHLGMTAMSLGIPVAQVFPQRKAQLLFRRLGLQRLCLEESRSLWRLPLLLRELDAALATRSTEPIPALDGLVRLSERHLDAMEMDVRRVAARPRSL